MNGAEKAFDARRSDLKRRLKNDPSVPMKPQFTQEEMQDAAQRLMASVLKTKKVILS